MHDPVAAFYDGFAGSYHLVYADGWEAAVERQAAALDGLIRVARPGAHDLLDCSCGIGTQAIGLARRGYRVTGTDLSRRAVERARREAARLGAGADFAVADFRDLDAVGGEFDVVLSYDNAIPHLLDGADIERALASMRRRLRPGGLLVVGIRDYDEALHAQPALAPPLLVDGPPRRLVARLHDWDAPGEPLHTVHFFILTEGGEAWTLDHHRVRYRALTREELGRAAEVAGFRDVAWLEPGESLRQPVLTACA